MAQINFVGNIGRDAELGFSQSGNAFLKFNVADTKGKKDAQGNWDKQQEKTQWFRCTLWGPDAEHYAERLKQGARVTVYGELMESRYTDKEGAARSSMDVTVRGLSVVNKRGSDQAVQSAGPSAWDQQQQQQQQNAGGWGNSPTDPPF